jgi:hypothetical protein
MLRDKMLNPNGTKGDRKNTDWSKISKGYNITSKIKTNGHKVENNKL